MPGPPRGASQPRDGLVPGEDSGLELPSSGTVAEVRASEREVGPARGQGAMSFKHCLLGLATLLQESLADDARAETQRSMAHMQDMGIAWILGVMTGLGLALIVYCLCRGPNEVENPQAAEDEGPEPEPEERRVAPDDSARIAATLVLEMSPPAAGAAPVRAVRRTPHAQAQSLDAQRPSSALTPLLGDNRGLLLERMGPDTRAELAEALGVPAAYLYDPSYTQDIATVRQMKYIYDLCDRNGSRVSGRALRSIAAASDEIDRLKYRR